MTEAPTSSFSAHPPYGDPAPLADTMPEGFASSPVHPVAEPERRQRRPARWILVGLGALAVIMLSVLVIDPFGDDPGGDDPAAASSTPAIAAPPAPAASATGRTATAQPRPGGAGTDAASGATTGTTTGATSGTSTGTSTGTDEVEPGGPVVVYEVTASGSGNVGSVEYTDQDGEIIRLNGIPLPWRTTFTPRGDHPLVLITQRKQGGDLGPVTCTVTVDGKVTDRTTARGRYAAPMC
jgi:hypothetical protein